MENGTRSPSAAPPTGDRRLSTLAWEDALAEYTAKRRPTFGLPEGAEGEDALFAAAAIAAMALVLNVPAPTPAALLIKVRVAFGSHTVLPAEAELEAIRADVARLFPEDVAHGE